VPVKLPEIEEGNPQIERMWASHRVQELSESGRRDGNLNLLAPKIVDLCESYSIVSEYASFIVLENDAEYQRWKIKRRNASRVERDRGARQAIRQQLETLRRQAEQKLGPATGESESIQIASRDATAQPQPGGAPTRPLAAPRSSPVNQPDGGNNSATPQPSGGNGGGGSGGGAIDPITAIIMAGLLAAGEVVRRRKRCNKSPN
jgi:hypothetical protein